MIVILKEISFYVGNAGIVPDHTDGTVIQFIFFVSVFFDVPRAVSQVQPLNK